MTRHKATYSCGRPIALSYFGKTSLTLTRRHGARMARAKQTYRRKPAPQKKPQSRRPSGRARGSFGRKRSGNRRKNHRLVQYGAEAGVFVLWSCLALVLGLVIVSKDLPDTQSLWRQDKGPKISLLATDGTPIVVQGEVRGGPVRLADLPPYVAEAILAVEDRNFYHHFGVNPFSIIRALLVNLTTGEVRQGGSTLTQQLAKNLFLSSEQTYKRKVQELLLAFWLEYRFTKEELLTLYLNRVYFGAGAYGIDAASYRYFDVPARELTLNESAVLAGLLKAPSRYAPTHNPDDAGARARLVLSAMVDAGYLTEQKAQQSMRAPVYLRQARFSKAPYFVDHAMAAARNASRRVDHDLIVKTTFDPALHTALSDGVHAGIKQAKIPDEVQVAGVIIDENGAVRALIGGRNYAETQFNRATQARRQPGSAFKPFVYLAGLEAGLKASDLIDDLPVSVGNWAPRNYGDHYMGPVSLATALARSLNGATIRLQEKVGRKKVRALAKNAGLTGPLTTGPSLGLGVDVVSPLQLAGAYAVFSNGGYGVRVHSIEEITDNDGNMVYQNQAPRGDLIADPKSVYMLNEILKGVAVFGTGKAAALENWQVAGKTGTTQNNRDAWFAGHVNGLVCVIWVGKDDNSPMQNITGGGAPAIIWREVMGRALISATPNIAASFSMSDQVEDDPVGALIRAAQF